MIIVGSFNNMMIVLFVVARSAGRHFSALFSTYVKKGLYKTGRLGHFRIG